MEKYRNIHIGGLIQQKLKEKKIPICQFTKMINCSRTNVYHIFKTKSIDTDKLVFISTVVGFDFLGEYYSKD